MCIYGRAGSKGDLLMIEKTYRLNGLTCADCALKIEDSIRKLKEINTANLVFAAQKLHVVIDRNTSGDEMEILLRNTVNAIEPGVEVIDNDMQNNDETSLRHSLQFKKDILILAAGIVLFAAAFATGHDLAVSFILLFMSWLTAGHKVIYRALSNITKGRIFDENLLMTIATVGAFVTGQYREAAAVMLFYKLGMIFEDLAVNHSRKSITGLLQLKPEYANLKTGNGIIQIKPESVNEGDILLIKPGERIPVDALVTEGTSVIDTSSLTGESVPKPVEAGDQLLGGCINKSGLLTVKAVNSLKQSAVSRIMELVEDAASRKAPLESFISKFAAFYTPAVTAAALLIAVLPPFITGSMDFMTWLYRAMTFLVISCPCALVVSIPLTFFAGIGKASSIGVLIKGGSYLDALNKVDTVVFDKTGTLTKGVFSVTELKSNGCTESELLRLAAYAEYNSTHPIARSIVAAISEDIDETAIESSYETAGKGIKTTALGHEIIAGSLEYIRSCCGADTIIDADVESEGTIVYIVSDGSYMGAIKVSDTLKDDAVKAVGELRKNGIKRIVMLTGDSRKPSEAVAGKLALDEVRYGLLPHEKAHWLKKIKAASKGNTIFVGDGINDAPVLANADIGVSMGGIGSDAAIEASDIVLMKDEPSSLSDAFRIASVTRKIAMQNIIFAISVKVLFLLLGALGLSTMWEAVFSDVGVTVLAVLNTLRIRHFKI